jgi:monovalent cation/hydrogen antiporter
LPEEIVALWRERERQRIAELEGDLDPDRGILATPAGVQRVELVLIGAARTRLNELLREESVSDEIRRRIERDLDLDEERLRRNVHGIATDDDDADGTPRRT